VDGRTAMDLLLALAVTAAAILATSAGFKMARRGGRMGMVAVAAPLLVLVGTALALNFRQLGFVAPFSWLAGGAGRWVSLSLSAGMTFGALAAKVGKDGQRRALLLLAGVVILRAGTAPFLGPIFARGALETMKTQMDARGVCLQSTPYNCGPAAAVTALRRLGFRAEEGELGLWCNTDPFTGTADDVLAAVLRERYGPEGLVVEHRYVKSAEELRRWPVSIAVIKFNLFVDHYVTVLGFEGGKVTLADPFAGFQEVPLAEFERKWDRAAILLRRETRKDGWGGAGAVGLPQRAGEFVETSGTGSRQKSGN
jgi:hypothetical protein